MHPAADTLRLLNHYNANIERYQWPERYRILEISGAVDSVLIEAVDWLEESRTWADLVEKIALIQPGICNWIRCSSPGLPTVFMIGP